MLRFLLAVFVISIFTVPASAEAGKPSCAAYCTNWCAKNSQDRGYCFNKCNVGCEAKRAGKK